FVFFFLFFFFFFFFFFVFFFFVFVFAYNHILHLSFRRQRQMCKKNNYNPVSKIFTTSCIKISAI
ncbi:hypothetical protein C5B41_17120, partial [Acinetobacter ursingii]